MSLSKHSGLTNTANSGLGSAAGLADGSGLSPVVEEGGGGGPELSALLSLDFTTQTYELDGVATPLGDLLTRTDMTIDANGARFDWNTSDVPAEFTVTALGAFPPAGLGAGVGGFTVIIEWSEATDSTGQIPIHMFRDDTEYGQIWIETSGGNVVSLVDDHSLGGRNLYSSDAAVSGSATPRRAGFTRTMDGLSFCMNGGTVQTDTTDTPYVPAYNQLSIAGYVGASWLAFDGHIRRIIVYDPVDDATLQTLTEVA